MTEQERRERARLYAEARPVLVELLEALRELLLRKIEETSPSQPEHILEMHRTLNNAAKLKHTLLLVVQDGEVLENAAIVTRLMRA